MTTFTPRAYGECGHATYRGILERRLEVKRRAGATGDPAERARLIVQATALKLVLKSTFGKLGDAHSTLFDPSSFVAVLMCVITMICWGSWANTQKLASQEWRFQLFYWDYCIGVLLLTLLFAFTLGSMGEGGRSFVDDLRQAKQLADA